VVVRRRVAAREVVRWQSEVSGVGEEGRVHGRDLGHRRGIEEGGRRARTRGWCGLMGGRGEESRTRWARARGGSAFEARESESGGAGGGGGGAVRESGRRVGLAMGPNGQAGRRGAEGGGGGAAEGRHTRMLWPLARPGGGGGGGGKKAASKRSREASILLLRGLQMLVIMRAWGEQEDLAVGWRRVEASWAGGTRSSSGKG
jgi:hypothetical protein